MQMDKQHRRPPPRGGLAIVSVSTRIVIFGGADRSPTLYDDLWVLETAAERNEWSRDPSSGACTDELVQLNASNWNWSVVQLIFGGAGHQGPLNDLWIFNTLSRQWTAVESDGMPPMPREMHSGTMADDSRMIVFGGRGTEQQVLSDLHELSLRQTEHIAIYGGFDGSSVRGDLLEIDPDTLRVRLLCKDPEPTASSEQLPEPRFAHGAATLPSSTQPFGKEMAVCGGVNPASDLNTVAIWRTA
eukprot:jgi/Astpho2/2816/Aster-x1100